MIVILAKKKKTTNISNTNNNNKVEYANNDIKKKSRSGYAIANRIRKRKRVDDGKQPFTERGRHTYAIGYRKLCSFISSFIQTIILFLFIFKRNTNIFALFLKFMIFVLSHTSYIIVI